MTAFSQQDTKSTTNEVVILPYSPAKQIVKDLMRFDSTVSVLNLMKDNVEQYNKKLALKDSIINNQKAVIGFHKEKESTLSSIITLKDQQIKNLEETTKQLNKDLKKEKRKKTFITLGGVVLGGFLIYGLIAN